MDINLGNKLSYNVHELKRVMIINYETRNKKITDNLFFVY